VRASGLRLAGRGLASGFLIAILAGVRLGATCEPARRRRTRPAADSVGRVAASAAAAALAALANWHKGGAALSEPLTNNKDAGSCTCVA